MDIEDEKYTGLRLPKKEYERIERTVAELYKNLNVTSIPIDPFAIAEQLRYRVVKFSELPKDVRKILRKPGDDGYSIYDPEDQCHMIY